nr:nadph-dependent diflavin oxidoreductase 1 [Quercus suber]
MQVPLRSVQRARHKLRVPSTTKVVASLYGADGIRVGKLIISISISIIAEEVCLIEPQGIFINRINARDLPSPPSSPWSSRWVVNTVRQPASKLISASNKKLDRTALVLYGSETGNAQDAAQEAADITARLHFDTTVLDMDSVPLRDLVTSTVIIFVISTTGQGEMPQNARRFWKALLSSALKPGLLRRMRFSSFGIGDASYARFNVAHRMLHGRLTQLGARPFCDRGEGNEQHPEGHSAGLRMWMVALERALLETYPLPPSLEPVANDTFLEPKWKLAFKSGVPNPSVDEDGGERVDQMQRSQPSTALLPVSGTHCADILKNERVTSIDHFQDVRLLDLRVSDALAYGPGAVAVIYPKNFPGDVQDLIDLMGWQTVADQPVELTSKTLSKSRSPSPLRNFDLTDTTITLRWLLENVLDIMSIPRRSFFANLVHFAGTSSEDEAYQKERLEELANPELIDELWDYTTRPRRTILEVMMDFTTIKIPWQYALTVLPIMRGRQFSIASGGHLLETDDGRMKVELLVAIADPPSPIIKWRRRYGVCTRYITTLQPGQQINIGIQPGYLDVQPDELAVPLIMIGPGTGVAPMRSMIFQRLAWARSSPTRPPGQSLAGDILIFGCRASASDYFFRSEWDDLARTEGLTVLPAFSRDKSVPRQYVQDIIRAHGPNIVAALTQQNGKVYVCGSSGNMPKGVREALLEILVQEADDVPGRAEAETYLDQMEKQGRYKQETW